MLRPYSDRLSGPFILACATSCILREMKDDISAWALGGIALIVGFGVYVVQETIVTRLKP